MIKSFLSFIFVVMKDIIQRGIFRLQLFHNSHLRYCILVCAWLLHNLCNDITHTRHKNKSIFCTRLCKCQSLLSPICVREAICRCWEWIFYLLGISSVWHPSRIRSWPCSHVLIEMMCAIISKPTKARYIVFSAVTPRWTRTLSIKSAGVHRCH